MHEYLERRRQRSKENLRFAGKCAIALVVLILVACLLMNIRSRRARAVAERARADAVFEALRELNQHSNRYPARVNGRLDWNNALREFRKFDLSRFELLDSELDEQQRHRLANTLETFRKKREELPHVIESFQNLAAKVLPLALAGDGESAIRAFNFGSKEIGQWFSTTFREVWEDKRIEDLKKCLRHLESGPYFSNRPVIDKLIASYWTGLPRNSAQERRVRELFVQQLKSDADELSRILNVAARAMSEGRSSEAYSAIPDVRNRPRFPLELRQTARSLIDRAKKGSRFYGERFLKRAAAKSEDWVFIASRHELEAVQKFAQQNQSDNPFVKEAKRIAFRIEFENVRGSRPGKLPKPSLVSKVEGRGYSIINIENSTFADLTVYYHGPEDFKVVFRPLEKGSVELRNGKYEIAAKVSTPKVIPYAGVYRYHEGNYQRKFYIRIKRGFGVHRPIQVFRRGGFTQWEVKRKLEK